MIYRIAAASLSFNGKTFNAVSGPSGNGKLPAGKYRVKVYHVVVDGLGNSYCAGGVCFFIPIEPLFASNRHGLGIHPNGNTSGTEGCIGLSFSDAPLFWKEWTSMSLASRPDRLLVMR